MKQELIAYQSNENKERSQDLPEALRLLMAGKPIALDIREGLARPSRRLGKPVLFIAPLSMYVSESSGFLFSLEGAGCVASTIQDLKSTDLQLMGLSSKSAKVLVEQLKRLVKTYDK